MHEKAASCSVRIRRISTTLHDHPTLRIPIGGPLCYGTFCKTTPPGPCDTERDGTGAATEKVVLSAASIRRRK
jgi:hypothetical protein